MCCRNSRSDAVPCRGGCGMAAASQQMPPTQVSSHYIPLLILHLACSWKNSLATLFGCMAWTEKLTRSMCVGSFSIIFDAGGKWRQIVWPWSVLWQHNTEAIYFAVATSHSLPTDRAGCRQSVRPSSQCGSMSSSTASAWRN